MTEAVIDPSGRFAIDTLSGHLTRLLDRDHQPRPPESGEVGHSQLNPQSGYVELRPQLQISMTDACNLNCTYCAFRARIGVGNKPVNMALETAFKAIDFFHREYAERARFARIDFGLAGEPMLRAATHSTLLDRIDKAFADSELLLVWAGTNTTNGTLFLREEYAGRIGPPMDISCDGPKHVHDTFRKYTSGEGTYEDVRKVADQVLARHPGVGASAVLTAAHTDFVGIFLHLREEIGFRDIYMKPVNVPPNVEYGLNPSTLDRFKKGYTELVDFLLSQPPERQLDYLLTLNPQDYFMRFVYRVKDRSRQVYRCGAGKSGAYVDTNGKLYPCAHFIGKTGWEIGDIETGFDEVKRAEYLSLHVESREPCRSCTARYLCGGGCYYQAVLTNGRIDQPDATKCELILHLCGEAARLIGTLHELTPAVLKALPSPFFVPAERLKLPANAPYLPTGRLTATTEGSDSFNLSASDHVEGVLLERNMSAKVRFTAVSGGLEILLESEGLAVTAVTFWVVDLLADPYLMSDLSNHAASEVLGIQFKSTGGGPLLRRGRSAKAESECNETERGRSLSLPVLGNESRFSPRSQNLRTIPFEPDRWDPCPDTEATVAAGRCFFRIPLPSSERVGFNMTVHLAQGSLVLQRYEPFCLISRSESGPLRPEGEGFCPLEDRAYNQSPIPSFEPVTRWAGLHANVC